MQRLEAPARPRVWWNEYVALFLTVWMVGSVVWALGHAGWDPLLGRLPIVAVPALAIGYGSAKTRRLPLYAVHSLALIGGALTCWLITITAPGVATGSPKHRTVLLWRQGVEWTRAAWRGEFLHNAPLFLLDRQRARLRARLHGDGLGLPHRVVGARHRRAGDRPARHGRDDGAQRPLVPRRVPARGDPAGGAFRRVPAGGALAAAVDRLPASPSARATSRSAPASRSSSSSSRRSLPLSVHIDAVNKAWQRAQRPAQQLYADVQERFTQRGEWSGAAAGHPRLRVLRADLPPRREPQSLGCARRPPHRAGRRIT